MTPAEVGGAVQKILEAAAPMFEHLAPAAAMVREHPLMTATAVVVSSGAGANGMARLLNRVPLGAWYAALEVGARTISRISEASLLRPLWKPFEIWLIKAVVGSAKAVEKGFLSDNGGAAGHAAGVTPQGSQAEGLPVDSGGPVGPQKGA